MKKVWDFIKKHWDNYNFISGLIDGIMFGFWFVLYALISGILIYAFSTSKQYYPSWIISVHFIWTCYLIYMRRTDMREQKQISWMQGYNECMKTSLKILHETDAKKLAEAVKAGETK